MVPPTEFQIRMLSPEETIPVRHIVLRQNQPIEACHFSGDDVSTTYHVGATVNDQIVGIATVLLCQEDRFGVFTSPHQMCLRGMAVLPEFRRQGIGKAVLDKCLSEAQKRGCELFWCNARIVAVEFYKNSKFSILNDQPFEIDNFGPHHVMFKTLSVSSTISVH